MGNEGRFGGGDCRGEYRRAVGDVAALFHVGELVTEGRYVGGAEGVGEVGHEGVIHSGAGSVAEDEEIFWFWWCLQKRGDFPAGRGFEAKVFWFGHCAGF